MFFFVICSKMVKSTNDKSTFSPPLMSFQYWKSIHVLLLWAKFHWKKSFGKVFFFFFFFFLFFVLFCFDFFFFFLINFGLNRNDEFYATICRRIMRDILRESLHMTVFRDTFPGYFFSGGILRESFARHFSGCVFREIFGGKFCMKLLRKTFANHFWGNFCRFFFLREISAGEWGETFLRQVMWATCGWVLKWHFCGRILWECFAGTFYGLLRESLAGHLQENFARQFCRRTMRDIFAREFCRTVFRDTFAREFYGGFLPESFARYFCRRLLQKTFARHFCERLFEGMFCGRFLR